MWVTARWNGIRSWLAAVEHGQGGVVDASVFAGDADDGEVPPRHRCRIDRHRAEVDERLPTSIKVPPSRSSSSEGPKLARMPGGIDDALDATSGGETRGRTLRRQGRLHLPRA